MTFPALDLARFDDAAFEQEFRLQFRHAVAIAAGLGVNKVLINSIAAGVSLQSRANMA